jgi:Lipid desaturase domain
MCITNPPSTTLKHDSAALLLSPTQLRQQWNDQLNERVIKLTANEIQKLKLRPTDSSSSSSTDATTTEPPVAAAAAAAVLAPEFVYAQQPKTWYRSGYPVYEVRNQYMVYFYTIGAISFILYATVIVPVHPLIYVICVVTMFLGYDLNSGILHVVFDHPPNIAIPILGQPCLEFQWHHRIPDDIVRRSFVDVCGDLNVVVGVDFILQIYLLPMRTNPICLLLSGCKLLMLYYGQFSHRSSHSVGRKLSKVAKVLQRCNLIMSTKGHRDHHRPPHTVDYCLIGVCNPIIDGLLSITRNNVIWLTAFFVWSIFDLAILTHIITYMAKYIV